MKFLWTVWSIVLYYCFQLVPNQVWLMHQFTCHYLVAGRHLSNYWLDGASQILATWELLQSILHAHVIKIGLTGTFMLFLPWLLLLYFSMYFILLDQRKQHNLWHARSFSLNENFKHKVCFTLSAVVVHIFGRQNWTLLCDSMELLSIMIICRNIFYSSNPILMHETRC